MLRASITIRIAITAGSHSFAVRESLAGKALGAALGTVAVHVGVRISSTNPRLRIRARM